MPADSVFLQALQGAAFSFTRRPEPVAGDLRMSWGTIEARICNDIGTKAVALPANPAAAQNVEDMLHDFIQRGVSDAVSRSGSNIQALSPTEINGFVTSVYEDAYQILQAMGDAEAAR